MKETLEAPQMAKEPEKRTHCKCCRVSLAKSKMPRTMQGLLAWHGRWLNSQTRFTASGHVVLDETLICSAGYPLPKLEVLEDLWNNEHRELIGYARRRCLVTDYKLVIHAKRVSGSVVNVAEMVATRSWKTRLAPVFARRMLLGWRCSKCKRQFTEGQRLAEEIHRTKAGLVCSDCYYGSIGESIEKHPISNPRVRRG